MPLGAARQVGWRGEGGRTLRGAAARGGARLSLGESRRKEHHGALPPGPPLRGGGSSPENPFSGFFGAGRGFLFLINWPAARSAEGPKASRPPLGRLGDAFVFPMGRTEETKAKNENTRRRTCSLLLGVRSRRVRTIGASRPIGGRLALGAWRCEGRRPLTPTEHLSFPGFHNPEKGSVRGGTSSHHPRGPGAAAPGALLSGLSPGESPGPRGSGPLPRFPFHRSPATENRPSAFGPSLQPSSGSFSRTPRLAAEENERRENAGERPPVSPSIVRQPFLCPVGIIGSRNA